MKTSVVRRGAGWVVLTPTGAVKNRYETEAAAQAAMLLEQHGYQFGGAQE